MNYNLVSDCISKNIPEQYISMIRELSAKYPFRPGCIKIMEDGNFDIISDSVDIRLRVDKDQERRYLSIKSKKENHNASFDITLCYSGSQLPQVSGFKRMSQGQFEFKSELSYPMRPIVSVSYYDNEAISVCRDCGGTWEDNFIEPDNSFVLAGDPGMTSEEFAASILIGTYDYQLGTMVYCAKNQGSQLSIK